MTQNKHAGDAVENITVIVANQNYYIRSVISKTIDFIATLFVAFIVWISVPLIDWLIVKFILVGHGDLILAWVIMIVVSVLIYLVLLVTVAHCFKRHAEEIEELHQRYTETESVILKRYLERGQASD